MKSKTFKVDGMSCASCQSTVEREVRKIKGIEKANVNLVTKKLEVLYNPDKVVLNDIISAVEKAGYQIYLLEDDSIKNDDFSNIKEIKNLKKRFLLSLLFTIPLFIIAMGPMILDILNISWFDMHELVKYGKIIAIVQLLLTIPTMIINFKYYEIGFKALYNRHPNMDSLISVGTLTAFLYGLYATYYILNGHLDFELYFESVGVILTLITLGKYMEAKSKDKTSEAIKKLINLAPKKATIIRDNKEIRVKVDEIVIDDLIIVKPGEKFSVDGVIINGTTAIDESMITGESIPSDKVVGDYVIGGSMNKTGNVTYRAIKTIGNSTLAAIIKLVSNAQKDKAPIARLADIISGYFVPIVIIIAILSSLGWYLSGQSLSFSLMIFVSVLIIACPCALGLATPTAIMVSTGKGAENGILIKNGEALEIAHKIDTVVFDKTGTITYGKPTVTDIFSYNKMSYDEIIRLVASLEKKSEHPLGQAIVDEALKKSLSMIDVLEFNSLSGFGVEGIVDDLKLLVGNDKLMQNHNININRYEKQIKDLALDGKTPIFIAINSKLASIIAIRDNVKENVKRMVEALEKMNIEVIMLTGDNKNTANAIALQSGIKTVISEVLPQEKHEKIKQLKLAGKVVAMVGDGINDAIALAEADIGIAIGNGTDIAIESANIVLMKENLSGVLNTIKLSRKTMKIIKENLFWAFIYNVFGIFIAAGLLHIFNGPLLNPMFAAFAMAMSSVSVLSNTLRLRKIKFKSF